MPYKNIEDERAYRRRRYSENKNKIKKIREKNKDQIREYLKKYRLEHKEELRIKQRERYLANHEEQLRLGRIRSARFYTDPNNRKKLADYRRRPEIRERLNQLARIRKQKLKIEVLTHYSKGKPECRCCGESELPFLTLDHVNNDGNKERNPLNNTHFYTYVKRQGFQPKYQVLCWNCNLAKYYVGECPHKKIQLLIAKPN